MATTYGSQGFHIFHSQINSSPSNGLVYKLLYPWYPYTIEFNENMYIFDVVTTFDTVNLDVDVHHVLQNIFLQYFSLGEFHKFVKFSFTKCIYAVHSPKFPSVQ